MMTGHLSDEQRALIYIRSITFLCLVSGQVTGEQTVERCRILSVRSLGKAGWEAINGVGQKLIIPNQWVTRYRFGNDNERIQIEADMARLLGG